MARRPGAVAGAPPVAHRVSVGLTATEYADLEAIAARGSRPLAEVLRLAVFGPGLRAVSWLGHDGLAEIAHEAHGRIGSRDELILRRAVTTDGRLNAWTEAHGPTHVLRTARDGYPKVWLPADLAGHLSGRPIAPDGGEPGAGAWFVAVGVLISDGRVDVEDDYPGFTVARLGRQLVGGSGVIEVRPRGPLWERADRAGALEWVGREIALGRWV